MIAKGKSIAHIGNAVDYSLKENKEATILYHKECSGVNGAEIEQDFKFYQQYNDTCKNNNFSFVLSPEPQDGNNLTNPQLREIAKDFTREMGLEKHQAIAILHQDKNHKHIHLFVNRIDENGKAYNDSYIGKKASRIADKVAKEKGLVRAMEVEKSNKAKKELGVKEIRNKVYEKHIRIVGDPKNENLAFNVYRNEMKKQGVDIIPTINKQGKMQGFRVEFEGKNFKASEIHRSLSIKKMNKEHKGEVFFNMEKNYQQQFYKPFNEIKKAIKPKALGKKIVQNLDNNIEKSRGGGLSL